MLELAPTVTWRSLFARVPARTPAVGGRRLTVGLLAGCVQRVVFPQVNDATVSVLAAEGCEVVAPAGAGMLRRAGAARRPAGRGAGLRAADHRGVRARRRRTDRVNAAGCGSSMKEYGAAAGGRSASGPSVRERSRRGCATSPRSLAELGPPRAPRHPLALRVAYHDACHLAHAQGIRQQPRDLLRSIPGIELLPIAEQDICCGSAGIYNLVEPDTARELGDRKAGIIDAAQPDVVATANPGCMLQISGRRRAAGPPWPVLHPIELLDASIRGADIPGRERAGGAGGAGRAGGIAARRAAGSLHDALKQHRQRGACRTTTEHRQGRRQ